MGCRPVDDIEAVLLQADDRSEVLSAGDLTGAATVTT